jgi:hypothetical protein
MDTDKFADGPVALPGDPHRLGLVDKRDVVAFLGAGEQVAVGAIVDAVFLDELRRMIESPRPGESVDEGSSRLEGSTKPYT